MRSRLAPLTAALAAILALVLGRSCLIEIAEPVHVTDDASEAGIGGVGNGGVGGAAGLSCDAGQKICNNECVSIDDPKFGCGPEMCTPCQTPDGSRVSCKNGECVVECVDNFIACGGECYGPVVEDLTTIPFASSSTSIDGNASEWGESPLVPIKNVCLTCTTNPPGNPQYTPREPPVFFFKDPAPPSDLEAYFRVRWNNSALYVLAIVRDDELFVPLNTDAGSSLALVEDSVELFVDGNISPDADMDGLGPAAHHVFIGLDGQIRAPSSSEPAISERDVQVSIAQHTDCYVLEARLDWGYVRGGALLPPLPGSPIRFDIGVNDWDTSTSDSGLDAGVARREYQVVWKDPGWNYANVTSGYPSVTLKGP